MEVNTDKLILHFYKIIFFCGIKAAISENTPHLAVTRGPVSPGLLLWLSEGVHRALGAPLARLHVLVAHGSFGVLDLVH